MVVNLEQKKIHFDLRFILIYNIYLKSTQTYLDVVTFSVSDVVQATKNDCDFCQYKT